MYLKIDRIGLDGVHKRAVVLQSAHTNDGTVTGAEAGNLVVGHEPLGDIDKLSLSLRIATYHVELVDDWVSYRAFQRGGYTVVGSCELRTDILAHQQGLFAVLFQINSRTIHFLTANELKTLGHTGKACHSQHQTSHQRVRHFQIPVVFDMANGKETLTHRATFLHEFGIGAFIVLGHTIDTTVHSLSRSDAYRVVNDSKSCLLPYNEQRDSCQMS